MQNGDGEPGWNREAGRDFWQRVWPRGPRIRQKKSAQTVKSSGLGDAPGQVLRFRPGDLTKRPWPSQAHSSWKKERDVAMRDTLAAGVLACGRGLGSLWVYLRLYALLLKVYLLHPNKGPGEAAKLRTSFRVNASWVDEWLTKSTSCTSNTSNGSFLVPGPWKLRETTPGQGEPQSWVGALRVWCEQSMTGASPKKQICTSG